jgi:hypothetical protein
MSASVPAVVGAVKKVFGHMAKRQYAELVALSNGVRITEEEIERAITGYGRRLVLPPDNAYELMNAIEIRGSTPRRWSAVMPLWTAEEGRSDLSMELTLNEGPSGIQVELDDIRVL